MSIYEIDMIIYSFILLSIFSGFWAQREGCFGAAQEFYGGEPGAHYVH
jgi:hypothetical protein